MKATDLPTLAARLGQLADYYGKARPTAEALKVWLDVLAGESIDDVQAVLTDWPRHQRALPTGDEVLRQCRKTVSDRLEAQAAAHSAAARDRWSPTSLRPDSQSPESIAAYRQFRSDYAEMLKSRKRPKDWAHKLRAAEMRGERLERCQSEAWRAVLGEAETEAQREARLEREAIQTESVA